jgi:hypothetical protein
MLVKIEFGHGRMIFWQSYPSWNKFQFPLSNFCLDVFRPNKIQITVLRPARIYSEGAALPFLLYFQ